MRRAVCLALAASIFALGCARRPISRELLPRSYGLELPPDPASAAALAFAQAQVGKRYCWGGSGPSCFDCSGLVQAAWRSGGAKLPRTSDAQGRTLASVSLDAVRPGDILWWSRGHVGLYLGGGEMIDAYHSGAGVVRRRAPMPERVLRVMP